MWASLAQATKPVSEPLLQHISRGTIASQVVQLIALSNTRRPFSRQGPHEKRRRALHVATPERLKADPYGSSFPTVNLLSTSNYRHHGA